MKSKRIMSALLAGVMLTSTVLASCSKQEKEPPKSKRTNVYSGDEITLPADITYIDRIDYKNGKVLKVSDAARAAESFAAVSEQFDETVSIEK